MNPSRHPLYWLPLAALALVSVHIAFEHFNGGVKTHHFLARADLPGFSNWLGIIILPWLGFAVAARINSVQAADTRRPFPRSIALALAGACGYGVALAASFHVGMEQVSFAAFIGLFVCALALPVYRAEYILGFVVGMMVIFGSVIPLIIALVFAALSFVVRYTAVALWSTVRAKGR